MPEVRLSVKAIIIREGHLLVLKCRDELGAWYVLPGGGQQVGETLDQALRRECLEELGCEVHMVRCGSSAIT
jgi:8-oxo-dGTP diphosphatase